MSIYKEFEEQIFNWMMEKHKKDPSFTFSVRQIAKKGSESDYFIGTAKSRYFATTFWSIPVNYAGSSSDLINIIFKVSRKDYSYRIRFVQTSTPSNKQNKYALDFIRHIKGSIKENFRNFVTSFKGNKIEHFYFDSPKDKYKSIDDLKIDVEKDLNKLLPLVNKSLIEYKKQNPEFNAERISEERFNKMITELKERIKKHTGKTPSININNFTSTPKIMEKNKLSKQSNQSLNQILFGPPGTGKTYNTINKALEIIGEDIEGKTRAEIKEIFDTKVKEGQIVFTTFHQSMSYEDFIEGIKPITVDNEVIYEVKPGIFKTLCDQINLEKISNNNFKEVYDKFVSEIKKNVGGKLILETLTRAKEFSVYVNSKNNLRFHANTEKAYEGVIKEEYIEHYLKSGEALDWPSYTKAIGEYLKTRYNYSQDEENNEKNFVLIIDEINRGNVSQIFGELITLIEEDKRLGKGEALEVILPYCKEKFGVPPNLFIIGTMNTADRSVEGLDAALRRRFSFEEMAPRPELVSPQYKIWELWWKYEDLKWEEEPYKTKALNLAHLLGISEDFPLDDVIWERMIVEGINENQISYFDLVPFNGINLEELLRTINIRIEKLLDKDHQIGHSYFMSAGSLEDLKMAFQNKIIPLLQEYFFGDFGKIRLVIGKGFFEPVEVSTPNIFAEFEDYDASEFSERVIHKFKAVDKMPDTEFRNAINLLLKK